MKNKKSVFRKTCLKRLREAARKPHRIQDRRINQALYQLVLSHNARQILLYIPLAIEVDIHPLIKRLRREGRMLLVPFMEGESFSLVKYRLPLERKRFGIREPKFSRLYRRRIIDLAIVPIVGTDSSFRRVGFGKGMYDRFYEKARKTINYTVFVSRRLCFSKERVTDAHDLAAETIITPETIRQRKSSPTRHPNMIRYARVRAGRYP
jgi:5-formyltetrahydrofolate cyclo-ligase